MQYRFLIFILACLFCHKTSWAQDIIYKKDQTEIQAKVLNVGKSDIQFKRFDNLDGPTYTIDLATVTKIVYENKTVDDFSQQKSVPSSTKVLKKLGKNQLTLQPLKIIGTENQVYLSGGVYLERIILKGLIGIKAGVFMSNNQQMAGATYELKFYPTRQGKLKYYTGIGGKSGLFYYENISKGKGDAFNIFQILNGINYQITKRFSLGLHTGIGVGYQNTLIPDPYVVKHDWINFTAYNAGFVLGVRF